MEFLWVKFKIWGVKCVCHRGLWHEKSWGAPAFLFAASVQSRPFNLWTLVQCEEAVKYYAINDSLKNKRDFTCEMS